MKLLSEEPRGKVYTKLIKYAINTSDVFMFFTCDYGDVKDYNKKMEDYLEKFMPLLIKTRHNGNKLTKWPGSISYDNTYERKFMFFRSDPCIIDFLLKPKRLYKWLNNDYPEDLCFYRNGQCWFATTAHEDLAYVITKSKDEIDMLKSMGIVFDIKDYDHEPSNFYEEY